jgi:hypothetical protein
VYENQHLVFFVKTNKAFHQGGFVFFSREEFDAAKGVLAGEVQHILQSEQQKDPSTALQSWGVIGSTTGEIVEEIPAQAAA